MVTKQAIFKIGDEVYGLNIMDVSTVEKHMPTDKVANAPKNVKGSIHLRGENIPVYSLRSKFGLEEREPDQDTRLIITNSNDMTIAYEVDKMLGINNLEPEQLLEVPPIVVSKNTGYLKHITNQDGMLVILLNHDGILSEDELDGIKKISKK